MKTKILLTGASGFIGTNLLEYFSNNDFNVLNVDFFQPHNSNHQKFWRNIDITVKEGLEREILNFFPDYIIHLAARTDLDGKTLDDYNSNTEGTLNLIKVCNQIPNLKRVIFTSSMLVCKPGYIPKHSTDYAPSTIYGESKMEMEKIIRREELNFDWAIVRPTSIWGPGFGVPYRDFFDMVIKKRYFHVGNNASTKTYGYIDNVVYQIISILNAPSNKINEQVFYLGDYAPTNIREWADEIANELDIKIRTVPYPLIKLAAYGGDFLKMLGINFPMTSFRLNNMTTDNIIDLVNTSNIAPNLPFTRIEGIQETLKWMSSSK